MSDRQNMIFYASWLDIIDKAPGSDSDKYNLILSLLKKGLRNEEIITDNPLYSMFQAQAFAQINSAQEKHQKRVEAGRKGGQKSRGGGAPKGNQNAKIKTTSKQQANDNENDNDNDNDNVNISFSLIDNENENKAALPIALFEEGQGTPQYENANDLLIKWRNKNE